MTGAFINALGILIGALFGLAMLKPLSLRAQVFFRSALGAFTVFFGLQLVWLSVSGTSLTVAKQIFIAALGVTLGFWVGRLLRLQRLLAPWRDDARAGAGFGIPFVDYARGDGVAVGPGRHAGWTPALIDDDTQWVRDYRGLWGLDTNDRFGGERAPSGPRYERDGSIRTAWANPLGWTGLLKTPPREDDVGDLLVERVAALERGLDELDVAIAAERAALRGLSAQLRSLAAHEHMRALAERRRAEVAECEAELNRTIATRACLAEERSAHLVTLSRPLPPQPPQAHISRAHQPHLAEQDRRTRFLRLWAAMSAPLLLASVVVVLNAPPLTSVTTVAVFAVAFMGVEAIARRRFLSFLASATLLAGAIALTVVFVRVFKQQWRIAVSIPIAAAAIALLVGNLGDLRYRRRPEPRPPDDAGR